MLAVFAIALSTQVVSLADLDLVHVQQGWGRPAVNRSVAGGPMSFGGRSDWSGVGTHSNMAWHIRLDGRAESLQARVGVDSSSEGRGSVQFLIHGDGRELFRSPIIRSPDNRVPVAVRLKGIRHLVLQVRDGGDGINYDHANWGDARISFVGESPASIEPPAEPESRYLIRLPDEPRINTPLVLGAGPNRDFNLRVACQGKGPISVTVEGLPEGLVFDERKWTVRGTTPGKGRYPITIRAKSAHGEAARAVELVVGEGLALTPPMGWNNWYIHYDRVSDEHIRRAADLLTSSGMADAGYQYVSIDDCWMKKAGEEPLRDENGRLVPNVRFPNMSALTEYIHEKGLRAGIYTSPGPWTCAGYAGSWQHEEIDARTFSDWGFDLLKYDWCSYGSVATGEGLDRAKRPYALMGRLVAEQSRDILFNLCQYGMDDVASWGKEVGGHSWRTTGDVGVLGSFWQAGLANLAHGGHAGPGAWNDPDYLLLGWVGSASSMGEGRPVGLAPQEQVSMMSLWSLMAAPLFFSGDMAKLDPFTLCVLTHPRLIAINQDPLGVQCRVVRWTDDELVVEKPLEDGSSAIGLFNLSEFDRTVRVDLPAKKQIREVWHDRAMPDASQLEAVLPRKGCEVFIVR